MHSLSCPSVAIIVLNWNGYRHSKECLQTLEGLSYPNYHIVLVDNASEDHSGERLKKEFPDITLIQNDSNLGFTGGNNAGISYALEHGFDYVLMLNNDTVVSPDFLDNLIADAKKHPQVGIIQPLILLMEDQSKIWSAGGKMKEWQGAAKTIGDRMSLEGFELENSELEWVTGCCMLIPSPVIRKVGSLQNSFFAYFEDVDWSLRMRATGYKLYLSPKSIIYHEGNASSKKQSKEGTLSPIVFYLHSRNQLFLLRRHVKFPQSLVAWPFQMGKYLAWISYFCLRGRFQKAKAVIRGIKDGLVMDHTVNHPLCP